MAELAPWRALYFNPARIRDLSLIVTPPYDVISPEQQREFYRRHPYNVIRLILPLPPAGDPDPEAKYRQAAADFRAWQREGILLREPRPALYYWRTEFTYDGQTYEREALVGLLRLEPLDSGVVRPHEKTFTTHKTDRFKLMREVQAHLSAVFALYPDPEDRVLKSLKAGVPLEPLFDFVDYEGSRQRFYRVVEPAVLRETAAALRDKTIFIADGHHRYETALAYQAYLRQRYPQASPRAGFNYVLMYLSNMQDKRLLIKPAHRLLRTRKLGGTKLPELVAGLEHFFEVTPLALAQSPLTANAPVIMQVLEEGRQQGGVFVLVAQPGAAYRLQLRPGIMDGPLTAHLPPPLTRLDVMVLNFLVFERVMHLTPEQQDDSDIFHYASTVTAALAALERGEVDLAFLLNPTRIEQVQEVAGAGLIMPRKSTYFYPKVPVGLVMHPIDPQEEVGF